MRLSKYRESSIKFYFDDDSQTSYKVRQTSEPGRKDLFTTVCFEVWSKEWNEWLIIYDESIIEKLKIAFTEMTF